MTTNQASTSLALDEVTVRFATARDWLGRVSKQITALDKVSLQIKRGEAFGLIGESGSGKSTLARVILGLLKPCSGRLLLDGKPAQAEQSLVARRARSRFCQIVFQDPRSSLDPRFRVWQIISEGLEIQGSYSREKRMMMAGDIAEQVGITREQLLRYPHELSGGQRQRVAIGRALVMKPKLLILDEPTSALDVTIQAQILNLLLQLQNDQELTYLFISHDVSVIEHMCDRVAVLYKGSIVESGEAEAVLRNPVHDYTQKLIESVPRIGGGRSNR